MQTNPLPILKGLFSSLFVMGFLLVLAIIVARGMLGKLFNNLMGGQSGRRRRSEKNIFGITNDSVVENCPLCGGRLLTRNGRFGKFYGCAAYPRCKFTKNIS